MPVTKQIELVPFTTPNFVIQKVPAGKRQDGFAEAPAFALSELDQATLEALCKEFRDEVMRKGGYKI